MKANDQEPNQDQQPARVNGLNEGMLMIVVVMAFLCFTVYELTLNQAVPELMAATERITLLEGEIQVLADRLQRSRAALTVAEQESGVVRQANRLLREDESARQTELNRLESELEFYRRLTGTGGSQTGLAIYTAEARPTESPLVFQFEITLTHNIRRAAIVSGQVLIDVEGTLDDRPVRLYWSQLTDGNKPHPAFRFKYFQQIDGYMALPANFRPTQLLVTLEPNGQRKPVTRNFDWRELMESNRAHDSGNSSVEDSGSDDID